MTSVNFFNPASILPNADVAVNPAPTATPYNPVLMSLNDSMNDIRGVVKQKRDLDALKREAHNIADYVEPKSPQLSDFLRIKADQYDLSTTDVAKERSGLLKSFIDLSRVEQQDRKIDKDEGTLRLENNWKYQLQGSEKQYEALLRDRQRWDSEENDRIAAENSNRVRLANKGIDTPPPVKRPYPREKELKEAEQRNIKLTTMGPRDIQAASTNGAVTKSKFNPVSYQDPVPEEPDLPSNPVDDSGPSILLPKMDKDANPTPPSLDSGPQLTEDSSATAPIQNSPVPVDDIQAMAQATKEEMRQAVVIAKKTVDDVMDRADLNKKYYEDPELLQKVLSKRESIKSEIEAIPNPGSQLWKMSVGRILDNVKSDFEDLARRTTIQEQKQQEELNKATMSYYINGDASKSPVKVIKKQIGGQDKYFTLNMVTDKLDDVTLKIKSGDLVPLTTSDKVDVTTPNIDMPSVLEFLKIKAKS